jgi:hypothetical protein
MIDFDGREYPVQPIQRWLQEVLSGTIQIDDAPPSIRSYARYFIYEGASEILAMETKPERSAALKKLPVLIRPLVEDEVKRLWQWERDLRKPKKAAPPSNQLSLL